MMEKRKKQNNLPWANARSIFFLARFGSDPRLKSQGLLAQNKKAEIEFFDKFDREGGYDILDGRGYKKILNFMKERVKKGKRLTIADMGCGSGAFTSYIKKEYKNARIIGVDISKGCIERAKRDFGEIEFVIDDVEKTKFKKESFDVIWYSGILHHFPDFSKVAKEAFRILAPGGLFFSYDPNFYNPAFWLYRHPNSPFYSNIGITSNERLIKGEEIKRVFEDAGFETSVKAISGIKFRYIEGQKTRSLLSIYNFLDKILGSTPLARLMGAFILGFGKKI